MTARFTFILYKFTNTAIQHEGKPSGAGNTAMGNQIVAFFILMFLFYMIWSYVWSIPAYKKADLPRLAEAAEDLPQPTYK